MLEFGQDIVDGKDSRVSVTVFADAVREYNFFDGVKEKEDIVPNAFYLDVSFVTAERIGEFIREVVDKRLDPEGYGVAVVGDGLMRNLDVVNVIHESGGFAER